MMYLVCHNSTRIQRSKIVKLSLLIVEELEQQKLQPSSSCVRSWSADASGNGKRGRIFWAVKHSNSHSLVIQNDAFNECDTDMLGEHSRLNAPWMFGDVVYTCSQSIFVIARQQ